MGNLSFRIFSLLFLLLISGSSFSQDTIRVSQLGLKPGTRENATLIVSRALELCKTKNNPVLFFDSGRYDFWPQYAVEKLYYESNTDVIPLRRCAILIEGFDGLTIDCGGSEFIFHDRIQPFTVDKSKNINIKNVSIDWDIPLTAQAEIMEVNDKYIDISVNVLESPYVIENGKLVFVGEGWKSRWNGVMEFERDSKIVTPGTGDAGCLGRGYQNYFAENLSYGLIRLNYAFVRKPAKGNYLVLRHSARDHAGTFITDSKNVTVENMNMFHNAGLGILSQYSENLTFRNINCVPNPAKNRILSGHDDGFHYSNCRGLITIDNCRFLALMDDPVNIHGTSVRVMEKKDSKTIVCKFMHNQSIGFIWAVKNDIVGFIENEAMNTFGKGTVTTFKTITPESFEISFSNPLPSGLEVGDALENLSWVPDVIIKNSFFGSNRARGLLLSTPGKVLIENNTFESSGSAILIPGDANGWYESGAVSDVLIRNNIFTDACMTSMYQFCEAIISISPEIPKPDEAKPFHRNIRIENNEFHPYDFPVLYAKSVDGLSFTGNRIIKSNRFKPFHYRKSTFTFEYSKNVVINNNTYSSDIPGRNITLLNTPAGTVKAAKKEGLTFVK
jgi:hypothetical protein